MEVITREHRLKGVAPALLAFLSDLDQTVRLATLRVLGGMDGGDAAPVVARFLDDPDETVRRDALRVLVEWRSPLAKPVLIANLSSPDGALRLEALRDLPKLGAVEAIPQIEERLDDPGASHRLMALSALFQMDALQSRRVIFERCAEGNADPNVAACALALLVKWDDQRATPFVMARLRDRRFADRNTMVNRLIEFEAAGIVPALIDALDTGVGENADADRTMMRLLSQFDRDPAVREATEAALLWVRDLRDLDALAAAVKADDCRVQLGAIEALGRLNDARCAAPLAAAFASFDVTVCEQAAWALTRLPKGLGAEALRTRLDDGNCRVRFAAAVGLMCCEGGASIDSLLARMKDRLWPCPNRRCLMLQGLDRTPSPVQIRMLLVLLKDDAYCIRNAAAYALRNCRDPVVIDPLIDVLTGDPHDGCRSTAARVLGSFNEPRVAHAFLEALKDPFGGVRASAMLGLVRCKHPQAIEGLLAALEPPSPGGRERLAVSVYIDALAHADARVRAKAQEMLRTISGQDFGEDRDLWAQWWREQTRAENPKPEPAK